MERKHNHSPHSKVGAGGNIVDRRKFIKLVGLSAGGLAMAGSGLWLPRTAYADAGARQRPIEDFLDAQGTTSLFTPPLDVGDYFGWFSALDRPPVRGASVDYAGIANDWIEDRTNGEFSFGTTIRGSITERRLKDGRAETSVLLQIKNAMTWAINIDPEKDIGEQLDANPCVFGARLQEIAVDLEKSPFAVGDVEFKIVFKNTAPGADLPDIVVAFILGQADPAIELVRVACRAKSRGPLREEFGVIEGTPGLFVMTQTGLFMTGFHGAVGDGFPAEYIQVRPLRR